MDKKWTLTVVRRYQRCTNLDYLLSYCMEDYKENTKDVNLLKLLRCEHGRKCIYLTEYAVSL